MNKKNIFIIHATISFEGGVGTVIKNLINYQINEGYKVGIVYIDNGNSMDSAFLNELARTVSLFPVKRVNFKGRNMLMGVPIKQLYLRIKKENPNYKIIFHAHNPVAVGVLNSISNIPLVCTIHGINPNSSSISKKITKFILNRLKAKNKDIIAVSEDTARYYNQEINSTCIKTIRNGVSVKKIEKRIENQHFTIGYTSNIDDLKGWRCIFDAYMLLSSEYKNKIKLVFAGNGPQSEIDKLKSLIKQYNMEDNIKYLGFVANAGDVLIPFFDILVLPSKSEGIPMTILEALGHGVPVLSTPVGGIPEVIKNGFNGFLLNRDPEEFSKKIQVLFNDKSLYNSLKVNAYTSYHNEFTNEIMGKKYDNIYDNTSVDYPKLDIRLP